MQSRPFSSRRGFTLVEIMIVAIVLSLLSTIAVPAFARSRAKARTSTIVNDLRLFTGAFIAYAQETGRWPADTEPGVLPPEMAGRIDQAAWERKTPIGGHYNWEFNKRHFGQRYTACIVISATADAPLPFDADALVDIDTTIDDGSLTSGGFRVGTGLIPLLVIERAMRQ